MAATGMALSLQDFIASLDKKCLPKILQVCSGVYFQGSVYELSGCEVCLSTGDLVKVIDIELLSVACQDVRNNETFELPISHKGLFKLVPEEMAYSTVEEMVSLRPLDLGSCLPFSFNSRSELTLGNYTVGANKAMTILCVEKKEGKATGIRCRIQGQQGAQAEVLIPLSCRGQFYECESEEWFTLQEIMSSLHLQKRRFRFNKSNLSDQHLLLSPVFQVHAIMQLRKNLVKFPSTLEVDVVDVSEQCKDMAFITPMTLTEAHTQPDDAFPTMAEVIEEPEPQRLFLCSWLQQLHKGSRLILHRKGTSAMVLASSMKGRKSQQYFLISQQYNGRFRRRPREFCSVYDLHVATAKASGLRVNVTRTCDEVEEDGLPALAAGEQLDVLRCEKVKLPYCGKEQAVDALVCRRVQELDDDDDDDEEGVEKEAENEEIFLPLYMQCHFVEKITDNKKHRLTDLGKDFTLPMDVKVVSRDAALETDPLISFPSLRLEEVTLEPTIQASLPQSPQHCFEIPTRWLSLFMSLTPDPLPMPKDQLPADHVEMVNEVTDCFYYEFRKQTSSVETPPPRPPKRNTSTSSLKSKEKAPKPCKKASSMTDNPKDVPKPPPKPGSMTPPVTRSAKDVPKPHPKDVKPPPKSNNLTKGVKRMTLNIKKRPPAPIPPDDDLPPPICPRKSIADRTSGNAKPNTYVTADKKGTISDAHADVDSDHDYEELDPGDLSQMIKRAQESSMFF